MTDLELITAACGIGGFAISVWSLKVARRAERGQREAAIAIYTHERRNSAAVHLQKYSDLLGEVRDATKAAKEEVQSHADEVLNSLYYLVDDVATFGAPRHSRHLFHEMSEEIFNAFAPELSFEHETNICTRFGAVRARLREMSDGCKRAEPVGIEDRGWFSSLLARLTSSPPNHYRSEHRLLSSEKFVALYSELDSRLDSSSGRRLLLESIDRIEVLCQAQRKLRPVLESGLSRLANALDRNSSEEFKLKEYPQLNAKIRAEMRALGLMARLGLNDITHFRDHDVVDALPEVIHAGAVLFTLGMVADRSIHSSEPTSY